LARIGQYVGEPAAFGSFDDAVAYVREVSASFGPHTDAQWRELTRFTFIERDGKWVKHYDLGLATPFGAMTPEMTQQGEAMLWAAYASIVAPILIVRGAESDLLSSTTLEQMLARNPRARAVEFAGVGHAPTFMARDQISAVVEFLHGD
jgi:pimeloyl-ACP methyl ester carboxylesterase